MKSLFKVLVIGFATFFLNLASAQTLVTYEGAWEFKSTRAFFSGKISINLDKKISDTADQQEWTGMYSYDGRVTNAGCSTVTAKFMSTEDNPVPVKLTKLVDSIQIEAELTCRLGEKIKITDKYVYDAIDKKFKMSTTNQNGSGIRYLILK